MDWSTYIMIPVKKNQEYIIKINDLTNTGEGIGKIEGFTIFVEGAIVEDEVSIIINQIKNNYAIGKIIKIIKPSQYRIEPPCEYFEDCGGCQIQNITYSMQLELKVKQLKEALKRIGKMDLTEVNISPIMGMDYPYNYRNKAQYKITQTGLGFYKKKSHDILTIDKCYIQSELSQTTIKHLNAFIRQHQIPIYNEETHSGVLRGIVERVSNYNKEIMLILVINAKELKYKDELINFIKDKLPNVKSLYININMKRTNVVLSQENQLIWGKEKIIDAIGDLKFEISPLSFFQVNPVQTKVLYDRVKELTQLTGEETVFDLYCGIGTIGLYLAREAEKVYGIEIIPQAIQDAQSNAILNGVSNAEFISGKAEEKLPDLLKQGIKPDIMIIDPPRKGCHPALLETIITTTPPKIIYISCNPATLARDLNILTQGGYKVEEIQPVDMFCHTGHVECVVLMSRVEK